MFYYVNGTVTELEAGLAVIDCGGVGYACATTNYTLFFFNYWDSS